jgi:hypothetical protein
MKALSLCQGWGIASAMLGRIAFCFYLLQFIATTHRFHAAILYFLIGSQALVNALCIILIYAQCGSQVAALWDHGIPASCWSRLVQRDFGYFQCCMSPPKTARFSSANEIPAVNTLADLCLTILPATLVWDMTLTRLKKLGVSILLGASLL